MKRHVATFFTFILGLTLLLSTVACAGPSTQPAQVQSLQPVKFTFEAPTKAAGQPLLQDVNFKSFHYLPGTLMQGSSDDIYYLTAAGTRRRVPDQATLRAFNLANVSITKVDDSLLDMLPLGEELTPLVWAGQANLYWVANGQRWLVNEWKPLVTRADYKGVPATSLDSHLEQTLPVRLGFESGQLLRDDQTIYYFEAGTLIPVRVEVEDAAVLDVPPGVLSAYKLKPYLSNAYLSLKSGSSKIYQGPEREGDLLGLAAHKITVTGRSRDGQWLQVSYQDQPGWLAVSQLAHPVAPSLLPTVADSHLSAQTSAKVY